MHRTRVVAAALVAPFSAAPMAAEAASLGSEPIVWSHRGSSYLARENTLPAFDLSAAHGADGFEVDLFLTADGQLAVFHDPTLNALTNVEAVFAADRARDTDGDGVGDAYFIADFTMDELRTLEVDGDSRAGRVALQADPRNPAPQPDAYRIPSYAEALDRAESLGQHVLTEVKLTDAGDAAERAAVQDALIAEWTARGYTDASSPVVVQAFSDVFMAEIDAELASTALHVPTVQLNFDAAAREALPFVLAGDFAAALPFFVPDQASLTQIMGDRYGALDGVAVILDVLVAGRDFSQALNPFGLDFIAAAEANGLDIYTYTLRIDEGAADPAAVFDAYLAALADDDFSPFFDPYLDLYARGLDGVITDNPDIAVAARAVAPAPVPLPAAGWMLAAALAGMAALRRR